MTDDEMRYRYLEVLLRKLAAADKPADDLLDRIERVLDSYSAGFPQRQQNDSPSSSSSAYGLGQWQ